jgi:hypothetical protein
VGTGLQRRLLVGAAGLAILAIAGPAAAGGGGVIGRAIGPIAIGDERASIAVRHGDGVVASRTPNPANPGNRNRCPVTASDSLRRLSRPSFRGNDKRAAHELGPGDRPCAHRAWGPVLLALAALALRNRVKR